MKFEKFHFATFFRAEELGKDNGMKDGIKQLSLDEMSSCYRNYFLETFSTDMCHSIFTAHVFFVST